MVNGSKMNNTLAQFEGIPLLAIIEDKLGSQLDSSYLKSWGFRLERQENMSLAFQQIQEEDYSAVLLDLWISGNRGLDALIRIRSVFEPPIFVIASRFESADRIMAYEMGADDFLTTELSPREIVARVRGGIKRHGDYQAHSGTTDTLLIAQDLQLNISSRTVFRKGDCLSLTRVEFEILATLMRRPGRICTREILLESTTQDPYAVLDRTVDVHITSLRRKLQDNARNPKYIHTTRGVGYSLLVSARAR